MRAYTCIFCLLASATLLAQSNAPRRHDVALTDITAPQQQYQVMTIEQAERISTQEEALLDIREKLGNIQEQIKEIKADVKVLSDTNVLVQFFLSCAKFLIPGLIITAFGVWFTRVLSQRKPARAKA